MDTVVVTGTQRYTQQEVIDATGIKTGDNLFLMNKYDVAQNIVGELPYIEEIRINRKLPDTLLIQVEECGTPLALVPGRQRVAHQLHRQDRGPEDGRRGHGLRHH